MRLIILRHGRTTGERPVRSTWLEETVCLINRGLGERHPRFRCDPRTPPTGAAGVMQVPNA